MKTLTRLLFVTTLASLILAVCFLATPALAGLSSEIDPSNPDFYQGAAKKIEDSAQEELTASAWGGPMQSGDGKSAQYAPLIGSYMFKDLPKVTLPVRHACTAIAFLMLAGGLGFGISRSRGVQEQVQHILIAGILTLLIAFCPYLLNRSMFAADSFANVAGGTNPYSAADLAGSLAMCFKSPESGVKTTSTDPTIDPSKQKIEDGGFLAKSSAWFTSFFHKAGDIMKSAGSGPIMMMVGAVKALIIILFNEVMFGFLFVAGAIQYLFLAVRFFLVYTSGALLPIFIAGLGTHSYRQQSFNYILGVIAICCWPLGYTLGHMGTIALFDWSYQTIAQCIGIDYDGIRLAVQSQSPEQLTHIAAQIAKHEMGMPILGLLQVVFTLLVTAVWVLVVAFSAPFVLMKTIIGGASFFAPMLASTGRSTVKEAGSAISLGSMALGASVLSSSSSAAIGTGLGDRAMSNGFLNDNNIGSELGTESSAATCLSLETSSTSHARGGLSSSSGTPLPIANSTNEFDKTRASVYGAGIGAMNAGAKPKTARAAAWAAACAAELGGSDDAIASAAQNAVLAAGGSESMASSTAQQVKSRLAATATESNNSFATQALSAVGYALGQSMEQFGERFNGDPSSLVGVPSAGINAGRMRRAQSMSAVGSVTTADHSARTAVASERMAQSMDQLVTMFKTNSTNNAVEESKNPDSEARARQAVFAS